MTISTWNLERLKHKNNLNYILEAIKKVDADILVFTEYDEQVVLDYPYQLATAFVAEEFFKKESKVYYKPTERRVKLFSHFEIVQQYVTFDKHTSLCVELITPKGNLIVYGTVIGVFGNRHQNFNEELAAQIKDFKRLGANKPFCVAGDFNISFSDDHYFTTEGRKSLQAAFELLNMDIATKDIKRNIDHIAISNQFAPHTTTNFWNENPKEANPILTDHMGVSITF